jgi:phospholipid transport system transporter-binding protein
VATERIAARIVAENDRWRLMGALTFDDAATVFDASKSIALPASNVVDLSGLTQADSSALAVVLAIKRRAASEGRALAVEGVPSSLRSLAVVYGVADLLA